MGNRGQSQGVSNAAVKSESFILLRRGKVGISFRRRPGEAREGGTRKIAGDGPRRTSNLQPAEEHGEGGGGIFQEELALPLSSATIIKVPAVVFERASGFRGHFSRILEKAKIRKAILVRASSCSWGLEAGRYA